MSKLCLVFIALLSTSHALIFECKFENSTSRIIVNTVYTCSYPRIILGNNEVLEGVNGTHFDGASNSDVLGLYVSGQQVLSRIPQHIGNFFPNLIFMQWWVGSLSSVTADDLEQFPKLMLFAVGNNKIVSLDGDLFQHNPKIQMLQFYSNTLEHVGHDLFTNLPDLIYADFSRNPCVDVYPTTKEGIQDLNRQLPLLCPFSETTLSLATTSTVPTTTASDGCSEECLIAQDTLARLENKIDSQTVALSSNITELQTSNVRQDETINDLTQSHSSNKRLNCCALKTPP